MNSETLLEMALLAYTSTTDKGVQMCAATIISNYVVRAYGLTDPISVTQCATAMIREYLERDRAKCDDVTVYVNPDGSFTLDASEPKEEPSLLRRLWRKLV